MDDNIYENQINELKEQIDLLKEENSNMKKQSLLEKAGCINTDLVLKAIPDDCEDIQEWIDNFKAANEVLFKQPPKSFGGSFKPSRTNILNPRELMNDYIRNSRRV